MPSTVFALAQVVAGEVIGLLLVDDDRVNSLSATRRPVAYRALSGSGSSME